MESSIGDFRCLHVLCSFPSAILIIMFVYYILLFHGSSSSYNGINMNLEVTTKTVEFLYILQIRR